MCVLIFSATLERDMIKKVYCSSCTVPIIVVRC